MTVMNATSLVVVWTKSSYSGSGQTQCVEAAVVVDRTAVRDSKVVDGPAHLFSAGAWSSLIAAIKR